MIERLPRWARMMLVLGLTLLALGVCFAGYKYSTRPTTLTVAVGSLDGDATRVMSAIAARLAETRSSVRLKVIDTGTAIEAAKLFSAGKADLATARPDIGDLSTARTIVRLTNCVALIMAPPGSKIEGMSDLKGKVVGVVGGDSNRRLVDVLDREYDLTRGKVQFKNLGIGEVVPAVHAKQVQALLAVAPITEKYLGLIRNLFPQTGKQRLTLVPIDSAEAISRVAKEYESYELPKGSVRGNPPIPDEDLTTLQVPIYLVGSSKLSDDLAAELAKTVMETRRVLIGEFPLVGQIAAPSTDKDAFIPIHPGAKAYFEGEQKTFFDKYGDQIFYGSMALGSLTSLLAAAWKFMGFSDGRTGPHPVGSLHALVPRIRGARSKQELDLLEEEIDATFERHFQKCAASQDRADDMIALCLATLRLDQLVHARRALVAAEPRPLPLAVSAAEPDG